MDTSRRRCLTPHSEAAIVGLRQGRDPGPVSLTLTLRLGRDLTVSVPNDPAAGCGAFVSSPDSGDRNTQLPSLSK